METKLILKGTGNENNRNYYIFEKNEIFFSLFFKFLINCKITNLGEYEDYQETTPDIKWYKNKVDHFQNEEYDIDVVFSDDRIVLLIRCDESLRDNLVDGISQMI